MRILVLTRNRFLYATRRIILALQRRGHDVQDADPLACSAGVGPAGEPFLLVRGHAVPLPDAVVSRTSPVTREPILRLLGFLAPHVPVLVNPPGPTALACDKFASLAALTQAGIRCPASRVLFSDEGLEDALASLVTGHGVILKTLDGGRGRGVCLADTAASARSIAQALLDEGAPVLIQHYHHECRSRDMRLLVVGGEVVTAARRTGKAAEFRANAHLGGTMEAAEPDSATVAIAIRSATALGLGVAAVDLLETSDGPSVIEVNATPGLRGVEESTGVDVATAIAGYVEGAGKADSGM